MKTPGRSCLFVALEVEFIGHVVHHDLVFGKASHNHGSGKWLYLKGNYYWRDPFFTSMFIGGRVETVETTSQVKISAKSAWAKNPVFLIHRGASELQAKKNKQTQHISKIRFKKKSKRWNPWLMHLSSIYQKNTSLHHRQPQLPPGCLSFPGINDDIHPQAMGFSGQVSQLFYSSQTLVHVSEIQLGIPYFAAKPPG